MLYSWEPRVTEILRNWDHALELYQDYRDDVERSIQEYDKMEQKYESVSYSLLEAEDQIKDLERENMILREKINKLMCTESNVMNCWPGHIE